MMKNILLGMMILTLWSCSTNWNFENTGLAQEHFDGTMYEYLKSNSYDWDSARVMIDHAKLIELFDGKEEITFFGPTNISIRKWMNTNNITSIKGLDKNECRTKILNHVLIGKILRDDIPQGDFVNQERIGGKEYTFKSNKTIWIYRMHLPYGGILGAGAAIIYLRGNASTDVASSNIQPKNGVIHALSYNYVFGSL